MNTRTKLLLYATLACAAMTTNAGAQGSRWCDCVTIDSGAYLITTGYWTTNGSVEGGTWINGGLLTSAGTACSYVTLPIPPNDFHYGADPSDPTNPNASNPVPDQYSNSFGAITTFSSWADWGPGLESVPQEIYANPDPSPFLTELSIGLDFVANPADPNLMLFFNGTLVYNGARSLFDPALFGLEVVGTRSLDLVNVWTQSLDNSTITAGSLACQTAQGITDNSYWRRYHPFECGLMTDYEVTACIFGVESSTAVAGNTPITVNIRAANPAWPAGGENDPILDTTSVLVPNTVLADQQFITATFPTPVTIPAGTVIAVEVMAPNGMPQGDFFFLGSNDLGETAPSYISAADCGIVSPTPIQALGFPDVYWIIDLECNPVLPPPIEYICSPANANSTGQGASLTYAGNRDITQGPYTANLTTTQLPANQFGYCLASRTPRQPPLPVSNGLLCLAGDIARLIGPGQPGVQNSGAAGTFRCNVDTGNVPTNPNRAIQPGETWYFQTWYRDQGPAGSRSNFSDACCVPFF